MALRLASIAASGRLMVANIGYPDLLVEGCGGGGRVGPCLPDSGLSFLLVPTWVPAPEEVVGLMEVSAAGLGFGHLFFAVTSRHEEVVGLMEVSAAGLGVEHHREVASLAFFDCLTALAMILS